MWTSFIGFMASGKSAVTRRLQVVTNRPALGLDQLIETQTGASIAELFAARGEAEFRALEHAALAAQDAERPLLVDSGGGLVQTPAAVRLLRERGVVIWLDSPWEVLQGRLQDSARAQRPLIDQLGWTGLEDLYQSRRRLYAAAADFRLRSDRDSVDKIAQRAMLRSLQWERRPQEGRR